jgi:hypothetical protein
VLAVGHGTAAASLAARRSLDRAARAARLARLAPRLLPAPRRRRRRPAAAFARRTVHLERARRSGWHPPIHDRAAERHLRAQARGRRSDPMAERALLGHGHNRPLRSRHRTRAWLPCRARRRARATPRRGDTPRTSIAQTIAGNHRGARDPLSSRRERRAIRPGSCRSHPPRWSQTSVPNAPVRVGRAPVETDLEGVIAIVGAQHAAPLPTQAPGLAVRSPGATRPAEAGSQPAPAAPRRSRRNRRHRASSPQRHTHRRSPRARHHCAGPAGVRH